MSKILVLGTGPLPLENPSILHGTCCRVWQLCRPIRDEGHEVHLCCMRITNTSQSALPPIVDKEIEGIRYLLVDELSVFKDREYIQSLHDKIKPDAVIGINAYPASRAALTNTNIPFWADLNGYTLGEAQLKAAAEKDNKFIDHFWRLYAPALVKADKFSSASGPQAGALMGELGVIGRLNAYTRDWNFIHIIPEARESGKYKLEKSIRLKLGLSQDDFVILWIGGYNFWCDTEMLFKGLDNAMAKNPAIHFVSTGGSIEGHDEMSFPSFQKLVNHSKYKSRYHFEGWVPSEMIPSYLCDADMGINIDRPCAEATYGARNRLTDMLKASLPIISTLASEISRQVSDMSAGLGVELQNHEDLTKKLLWAAGNRQKVKAMKDHAWHLFSTSYTSDVTTMELRKWLKNPTTAPDKNQPIPFRDNILRDIERPPVQTKKKFSFWKKS